MNLSIALDIIDCLFNNNLKPYKGAIKVSQNWRQATMSSEQNYFCCLVWFINGINKSKELEEKKIHKAYTTKKKSFGPICGK